MFLSLLLIISRIPFMAKFLFDWDSVGFALSFENFNLALAQPQSPGYIFYVALGKMLNIFFNDPNLTMIFINIVFSVLTVLVIYFLAKQMFSRIFAIIASLLLIFNPIFWFYGEIAAIYISQAFFASLIAYTSYQMLRGDDRFLYISALVMGLSGGFRQDMLLFMFPLWFFCLISQCRDIKKLIKVFLVLIVSAATWFIPTILLAGGLENYLLISRRLFTIHFSGSSIFYGANITQQLIMDSKLLFWTVLGMGFSNTFILLIYIFYKIPKMKLSNFKNPKFLFILLWIVPTFLFYLLIFFAKPGYLLVYLPSFALILTYVILDFSAGLNRTFRKIPTNYFIVLFLALILASGSIQFVHPSEDDLDYTNIQKVDSNFQDIHDFISKSDPNEVIVITDSDVDWRKLIYYSPDYETYCYVLDSQSDYIKELLHYQNGTMNITETKIRPTSKIKIIWIVDANSIVFKNIQSKIDVKSVKLPNNDTIYYSEVNESTYTELADIIKINK